MCFGNGWGGSSCWIILILVLLFCCCGSGWAGNSCVNDCGCANDCGCC